MTILIEEILIFGFISGGIYALLALGFTLIYGVTRVVNLAHGSFFMIGTYIFWIFTDQFLEIGPFPSLVLAFIISAAIAAVLYRLIIHPILGDEIGVMVATVSLAIIIQEIIIITQGSTPFPVAAFMEGSIDFAGLTLTYTRIIAVAVSIPLFIGLWLFIEKSKAGKAMRAVAQDREAAMLMGVNTNRLYILTMALSAALAAIAGVFVTASVSGTATPWMWIHPLSLSFSIVILGGLGSVKGSLIGGFIIGFAEQIVIQAHKEGFAILSLVPFAVMVFVLLLRPKGLFGKKIEMED